MKINLIAILLFVSVCVSAQSMPDYKNSVIEASKSWIDLDYVGDNMIGHKLDIFLPKQIQTTYPIIFTIYGSAFFSNSSKANCFQSGFGQSLLENGFAVVTINHRSSRDAIWPAQIHDIKAAIRFIKANASMFLLDTNSIGFTGFSSGGHLSSMAGLMADTRNKTINGHTIDADGNLGKHTSFSAKVNAVVDWFGPTDFLQMDVCGSTMKHDDIKSPESSLIGGAIQNNKEKTALANPLTYVHKGSPPFLIIHGNKDPLVPHCQSELLHSKLKSEGVSSELIIVEGVGHGPGVMIDKYYDKMIQFFKQHLNK